MTAPQHTPEHERLEAHRTRTVNWKEWGPYLAERAWGTVREDYSRTGGAWDYFPHDHARSRVYRWNEDGLAGISDRHQHLCFALALWNGHDRLLKERLFGLSGPEGNHGEDVKEYYYYLDNTPTHSYMKMLYKYPQEAFPYDQLVRENRSRGLNDPEYELIDTGIFDHDHYFDVFVEYAKNDPKDLLIQITVVNRSSDVATCTVLPTLWYRNTWSWGYPAGPMDDTPTTPTIAQVPGATQVTLRASHPTSGTYYLYAEGDPASLFTNNETNRERLFRTPNISPYVKDAFHRAVIQGEISAVNPAAEGTKAALRYDVELAGHATAVLRLRLSEHSQDTPFAGFEATFAQRKHEADVFYGAVQNPALTPEEKSIQRQAAAGLLWTKQLYYYDVEQWLKGDPGQPAPPPERKHGRNQQWESLVNFDIISMPDKWEYPWYASWDLAFHCMALAPIDPDFAKRQLLLMTREWYMHPNGQLPAYEWEFCDANPPVHAWASKMVYRIDALQTGQEDRKFLESVFHKLLLNFTWWVNQKDRDGRNVFQGGFLGMDNISLFDRSHPLPVGGQIDQSDGTAWMAFYCIVMMKFALALSRDNPIYQDSATKFFEHFLRIARAMSYRGDRAYSLWNEEDGFFYDALHLASGEIVPLKIRSLVGLLPLLAVEVLEPELLDAMPVFKRRLQWFVKKQPVLSMNLSHRTTAEGGHRSMIALVSEQQLRRILATMLDENHFLSPYGLRSLSKFHEKHPFIFSIEGKTFSIRYEPAESETGMFGGNSNWRGPIWFPVNFLIISALRQYHDFYGDTIKVDFPTGSGVQMNLAEIADQLSRRLISLFVRNKDGIRPCDGTETKFQQDPHWRNYLQFCEYFHGDTGKGLGASHQTGWTGLIALLLQQTAGNPS